MPITNRRAALRKMESKTNPIHDHTKYDDVDFCGSFLLRQFAPFVEGALTGNLKGSVPNIVNGGELFYETLSHVSSLFLKPNFHCADIGCATGRLTGELAKKVPVGQVIGIDFSPTMVKLAEKIITSPLDEKIQFKAPVTRIQKELFSIMGWGLNNCKFQIGDAHNLEFPNNSFDFVACINLIHRTSHPPSVIGELSRIVKPSGFLLVSNSYDWEPRYTPREFWFDSFRNQLNPSEWEMKLELSAIPWITNTYDRKYTVAFNEVQVLQKKSLRQDFFHNVMNNLNIL